MSTYGPEGATNKRVNVFIKLMGGGYLNLYFPDNDQTKTRIADFVSQLAGGKLATLEDGDGALHLVICLNVERVCVSTSVSEQ